jgi:catechol 1,2-dioxygenase
MFADLDDDSVFAVKDKLVVNFKPISKDYKPPAGLEGKMVFELEQNFVLAKADKEGELDIQAPMTGLSVETNGTA